MAQFESTRPKPVVTWRKSELVGALIFLYYMRGESFAPEAMPRGVIAEMLGVNRHRIARCIQDAEGSMALAQLINKRLVEYDAAPKPKVGRPPGVKNKTPRQRKEKPVDPGFKTKGKRNRNMSLRPMRQEPERQGSIGA